LPTIKRLTFTLVLKVTVKLVVLAKPVAYTTTYLPPPYPAGRLAVALVVASVTAGRPVTVIVIEPVCSGR
jgi:hypothetical protein